MKKLSILLLVVMGLSLGSFGAEKQPLAMQSLIKQGVFVKFSERGSIPIPYA